MTRIALAAALLLATSVAKAQSFDEYVRLRTQHNQSAAASADVLRSFVGSKVFEFRGVVKGSYRDGDHTALLLDFGNGEQQAVEAVAVSDWLLGNETPARMLIRAIRPDNNSILRLVLIGAAKESNVAELDAARTRRIADARAKAVAKAEAQKRATQAPEAPRGGSPLYGSIGRGGARLASRSGTAPRWNLPINRLTPYYAAYIQKVNPHIADAQADRVAAAVLGFSRYYQVDPRLVMALLMVESGFDPNSVSKAGAMGLGQLMPGTAKWMGVRDPFDETENLYGSIKLLRTHLNKYQRLTGEKFESLVLTLAAYNAGEGAVRRHGGVPPYAETQRYIQKVLRIYARLIGR